MRNLYPLLFPMLFLAAACGTTESAVYRYPTTCIVLDPLRCDSCCAARPDFLREDSRLCIRILNVNPFSGIAAVSSSSVSFNLADPPDALNFEKMAAPAKPVAGATTAPKQNYVAHVGIPPQSSIDSADRTKKIDTCMQAFQGAVRKLKGLLGLYPKMVGMLDIPYIQKDSLVKMIGDEVKCVKGYKDTCCCYRNYYDSLMSVIQSKYDCIQSNFQGMKSTQKGAALPSSTLSGDLQDNGKTVKLSVKNAVFTATAKESDDNDKKMAKIKAYVENLLSDSSLRIMEKAVDSLTSLCIRLQRSGPFEQCWPIQTVTGDLFTINPFILHGKDTVRRFGPFTFKTYGGFRLNFSTGLGFSFLNTNDSYTKEKASADSFRIRKSNTPDAFLPSIVAYLHAYWRSKHRVTAGMTAGISTNLTSLETSKFFLGASMLFGEDRRFILSGGVTGGQTDRLARNFVKDKEYANADYTGLQDKDLVEKKFRLGLFLGFSYNLSAKR